MKLKLSFKVHLFSCFRYYLIYFILLVLSFILKLILKFDSQTYLSYVIISGILFSIVLGTYEYLVVLHTYLNFQPNTRSFWLSSIFANLFNSIVCLLLVFIVNLILLIANSINLLGIAFIQTIVLFIFAYSLGTIGYIFLRRIKYLGYISIIILIICLFFFGSAIQTGVLNAINYYLSNIIICIIPLILTIIFEGLILFRLQRFIK